MSSKIMWNRNLVLCLEIGVLHNLCWHTTSTLVHIHNQTWPLLWPLWCDVGQTPSSAAMGILAQAACGRYDPQRRAGLLQDVAMFSQGILYKFLVPKIIEKTVYINTNSNNVHRVNFILLDKNGRRPVKNQTRPISDCFGDKHVNVCTMLPNICPSLVCSTFSFHRFPTWGLVNYQFFNVPLTFRIYLDNDAHCVAPTSGCFKLFANAMKTQWSTCTLGKEFGLTSSEQQHPLLVTLCNSL